MQNVTLVDFAVTAMHWVLVALAAIVLIATWLTLGPATILILWISLEVAFFAAPVLGVPVLLLLIFTGRLWLPPA